MERISQRKNVQRRPYEYTEDFDSGWTSDSSIESVSTSGKSSTFSAFLNLLKAFLGTGVVAVPYATRCGGSWGSIIGLILLALVSNYTMKLLIRVKRKLQSDNARVHISKGNMTLDEISYAVGGRFGYVMAVLSLVATNVGVSISYAVFFANTMLRTSITGLAMISQDVNITEVREWIEPEVPGLHLQFNMYLVLAFVVVFPLSFLQTTSHLSCVSGFGNVTVILVILAILQSAGSQIAEAGVQHMPAVQPYMSTFFGISVFNYVIHGVVLSVEADMK
eukprot:g3606.t1